MDKQNEILQELLSVDLDSIVKSGQQKDRRRKRRLVLLSVVVCFLVVALFAYPHFIVDKDANVAEGLGDTSGTTEERQESGENAEQEDVISTEDLQQAEQIEEQERAPEVTEQEAPSKEVVEQLQPKDENEQQEQKKPEAPCSHSFAAWDVTKEPTCKQAGEKVRECSLCGSKQTEEIPAGDHVEVMDAAVAATCTSEGKTAGAHCSVCGAILVSQSAVPMTKHAYSNGYCAICGGTETVYYNNGVLSYQSYIGAKCLSSQVDDEILSGYVAADSAGYSYSCTNIADFNKYVDYVDSTSWFATEKESTTKYGGQYESIIYANSMGWLLNCVYSGAYNQVLIYVVK